MKSHQSNNALMQQLKKHYNLRFELFSPEADFFFGGAQRQHNLETLRHLSSFGDMVLFLTGEKGAGKTTLLKTLKHAQFDGLNVVYLSAENILKDAHGQANGVFLSCARELSLSFDASASPSDILNALLKECHRLVASEGVRTLFAFDDADKLPKKDIQTLIEFCRNLPEESALVMLFSGSSSLLQWSKLGSNLEQAAWCHQIQLKPFSQSDVFMYLEQALAAAKFEGSFELSELQLQQLSELGKGLPGRINKLFPSVVLEPGLLKIQPRKKKSAFPMHILFGLVGLLVISFVFVSYQHGIFDRMIPVFSLENEGDTSVKTTPKEVDRSAMDGVVESEQQKARLALLDSVLKEKGLSLEHEQSVSRVEESVSDVKDLKANVLIADQKAELDEANKVENIKTDSNVLIDSAVDSLEDAKALDKNNDLLLDENKVVDTKVILPEHYKLKSWLENQPSSSYMAQILGSYQEQTAQKFIKKIGKQKFEVYYLKTEHKGKPWYVVFYGIFPAKTHAQDAIKNAPKVIRSQNPWIRRASDVLASYPASN